MWPEVFFSSKNKTKTKTNQTKAMHTIYEWDFCAIELKLSGMSKSSAIVLEN